MPQICELDVNNQLRKTEIIIEKHKQIIKMTIK